MYSVVLMMALSGSAEVPDFGHRRCHGCEGAPACAGSCEGRHRLFGGRRHRCHGCEGASAPVCCGAPVAVCVGAPPGCAGGMVMPPPPPPKGMPPKKEMIPPPKTTQTDAPAAIMVSLPAGARLTIDGRPTQSVSETRYFISPNLQRGRDYVYTLRAELVRDGQPVAQEQQVTVRAGQEYRVPFTFAQGAVVSR
jgi:uncharacterized protein (TIGR03000 family)